MGYDIPSDHHSSNIFEDKPIGPKKRYNVPSVGSDSGWTPLDNPCEDVDDGIKDANPLAKRFNKGKLRWMLTPVEWMEELARVLTKGAFKYGDKNWMNSLNTADHDQWINDRLESAYRHIAERRKGNVYDEEIVPGAEKIQTTHMGHAAWNLLTVYFYDFYSKATYTPKI